MFLIALFLLVRNFFILYLHLLQHFCCSLCRFSFHALHCQEEKKKNVWGWPHCFFLLCTLTCHYCCRQHVLYSELTSASKRQLCSSCSSLRSQVHPAKLFKLFRGYLVSWLVSHLQSPFPFLWESGLSVELHQSQTPWTSSTPEEFLQPRTRRTWS